LVLVLDRKASHPVKNVSMPDIMECFTSTNAIALFIAAAIFLITVALLGRRLIGFFITLMLLFFAIAAGLVIANNDLFRQWIQEMQEDPSTQPMMDQLKEKYEEIKRKIESLQSPSTRPE